ncbi:MAG: hypothetical protein RDU59_07850 [Thermodesulfobacteriota bacterium]|nr:hypothetical protein [Thermodesulfobacteriota bacterium]
MDIEGALRRYILDELLLLIGTRIRQLYDDQKPIAEETLEQQHGLLVRRAPVTLTAWQLSDLAYLAILHTHDFASRMPSREDLVELMNLFHERDGRVGSAWFEGLSGEDATMGFTLGFSQKQFWYQELHRIRAEFNRQVEILEVLSPCAFPNLGLDSICQEATGFDLRTFRKLAFALYAVGGRNTDLTHFSFDRRSGKLDEAITTANVHRLMDFYTADYRQIRQSPLAENAFFAWPIVRTATNRRIAVNEYFLARKIADGPYWILRDHFMSLPNRSDQETFVRHFGKLFDLYFEELLKYYFPRDSFRRVAEIPGRRNADWILQYHDWTFIIELKSAFIPLAVRRNYPDPAAIRAYLPKLSDGIRQLDATAADIGDHDHVLKILVHYEPLFVSDGVLRPLAIRDCSKELVSQERVFFSDLEDIESLFQVMYDAPTVAQAILRGKLDLETRDDGAARGREFHQVIQRNTEPEVNRFVHHHIDHYSKYIFPDGARGGELNDAEIAGT